jgi:hypothetical protein
MAAKRGLARTKARLHLGGALLLVTGIAVIVWVT